MTEAVIHAVPITTGENGHVASRTCRCGPRAHRDLAQPERVLWVHRVPASLANNTRVITYNAPPSRRDIVDGDVA